MKFTKLQRGFLLGMIFSGLMQYATIIFLFLVI